MKFVVATHNRVKMVSFETTVIGIMCEISLIKTRLCELRLLATRFRKVFELMRSCLEELLSYMASLWYWLKLFDKLENSENLK